MFGDCSAMLKGLKGSRTQVNRKQEGWDLKNINF
jgi:hypothetical protein